MSSRKRLLSILSSALVILTTAVMVLGNENNYSLDLPSDKVAEGTYQMDFQIGGRAADYYQLAFGPEHASTTYHWVESLNTENFTVKNMPAISDTYIRIFAYTGETVHSEDFKITPQEGNPQIESFKYTKNKVQLDIIQTIPTDQSSEPEPTTDNTTNPSAFNFLPADGSEMLINTFTVTFPKTNIAYYGVGTTLAGADIAYGENLTTDHITFSSANFEVGDTIYVKIADQDYNEFYAEYTVAENSIVTDPVPQPEPEPQPEPNDSFIFSPANNSQIPMSNSVTINFPNTVISYYGVGTTVGGANIAYGENLTTDHITFSTANLTVEDIVYVKIADQDYNEFYAEYTLEAGATDPSPTPEPDPNPTPEPSGDFSFSPETGSTISQGIDVTISFPMTKLSYYAVGEGGQSGYEEGVTIDQITFNTSLYQKGDIIQVKVVEEAGIEHYASYTVGETVDPYPDYDPGYNLSYANGQRLINGCPIFTPDSYWNQPIDQMPVDELSDKIINRMNIYNPGIRADFGDLWLGHPAGIPFSVVDKSNIKVTNITYPDSSDIPVCDGETKKVDEGCYPVPGNIPVHPLLENVHPDTPLTDITPENFSGDLHMIALEQNSCKLYEFFRFFPVLDNNGQPTGNFTAGGPTIWDLNKNADKFVGQKDNDMTCNRTSADAAGLPILPGLVLYDEVKSGEINHALRFTTVKTRRAFVYPATHYASWISKDTYPADGSVEGISYLEYPPMGARFRLKADYDISSFHPDVQVVLRALKKYGGIVADNGGQYFFSGAPDKRWNNEILNQFKNVDSNAFEVVEMGKIYDPEATNALGIEMDAYNCKGIESNHVDAETFRLPDYAQ